MPISLSQVEEAWRNVAGAALRTVVAIASGGNIGAERLAGIMTGAALK